MLDKTKQTNEIHQSEPDVQIASHSADTKPTDSYQVDHPFYVSSSPHIFSKSTTQKIMLDVLIALLPATIASIVLFGYKALILVLVCTASAVFFEWAFQKICKQKVVIGDLSAAVTG